jgi:hypothetical protein
MNLQDQKNTLQEARAKLEALLRHFTRTPSTLADTTARGDAHKALDDIDSILASMAAQEAAQSGHTAQVVAGNLANRLEWVSDEAHESTPVGTKLFDEAALAAATAAGRDAGLEEAAKALASEAVIWEQRSQGHSGMLGAHHAKEDMAKRDLSLAHMSLVRDLTSKPAA